MAQSRPAEIKVFSRLTRGPREYRTRRLVGMAFVSLLALVTITSAHGVELQAATAVANEQSLSKDRSKTTDYENWHVTCGASADDRSCRLWARAMKGGMDDSFAELSFEKSNALLVITTPLKVLLEKGLVLEHGERAVRLSFGTCLPQGCIAELSLNKEAKGWFRTASYLVVTYIAAGGRWEALSLSLKGFVVAKKAFDAANSLHRHDQDDAKH